MRKIFGLVFLISLLVVFCSLASAQQTEWKDPAYNFGKIKTILVMNTNFTYDGFDVSGNNKFVQYPYAEENSPNMLKSRLSKMTNVQFISLSEVAEKVKARADFPGYSPGSKEFLDFMQSVALQYADAVLFVEVRDYGWYYKYYAPYDSTETKIERVEYGGVTPDGKKYSGWRDVPTTVTVHHDGGYNIFDSAEVVFALKDAATWNFVWKYSDSRTRNSFAWGQGYDSSGPESMMQRIMDNFIKKVPFALK